MKSIHFKKEQFALFVILGIFLVLICSYVLYSDYFSNQAKIVSAQNRLYRQEPGATPIEDSSASISNQTVSSTANYTNSSRTSEEVSLPVYPSKSERSGDTPREIIDNITVNTTVNPNNESDKSSNSVNVTGNNTDLPPHEENGCGPSTACGDTIIEHGVTKWCRNMNGDGYKWYVKQYCDTGCTNFTICQNNPVGIFAQVGITTKATQGCPITTTPTNLVCRSGGWQPVACGDGLCTPEAGENEATCKRDCIGITNAIVDTTGYWPLAPGNYWMFDGRVTGDVSKFSNASRGDTFSTMLYIEPEETICNKKYYPVVFSKNKDYGYWSPSYPQNLRWFVSDYTQDDAKYYETSKSNQEYISAPISKFYNRNSNDPHDNSNFASIAYFASEKPENYPPYVILPRKVALNKTILNYQNTKFILHEFSNCDWTSDPSQYSHQVFYTWMLQYQIEQISTPAYTGEVLRVRFDERKLNGSMVGREDWYFAKDVGVVRIHWYSDWNDPEGSTKEDLVLSKYGNSATVPDFN